MPWDVGNLSDQLEGRTVHAQSPRQIERCAELGRYGRLTGSLHVPWNYSTSAARAFNALAADHSNNLTFPLVAFQAKWPPAMYRASKPALRKVAAVSQPMWKP